MKSLILCLAIALSGCTTPPTKFVFPQPPVAAMVAAEELEPLPAEPLVLSNATESIVKNYSIANTNRVKLETLQAWIKKQLELYSK